MKYNPITKTIYTDEGELVKQLNCPYSINWDNLEVIQTTARKCSQCDHLIIDTAYLNDVELLNMLRQNPDTCLKLDLDQPNVTVIVNGKI